MIGYPQPISTLLPVNLHDPINWQHPLALGLKIWWLGVPGWDGGATIYDLCGLNNGTLTSMGNTSNGWVTPTRIHPEFSELLFDGTAGYVSLSAAPVNNMPISMAFWGNYNSTTTNRTGLEITRQAGDSIIKVLETTNRWQASYLDSSGSAAAASTAVVTTNQWNHVVGVFPSSSSRSIYLNGAGKVSDSTSKAGFTNSTTTLYGAHKTSSIASQFMSGRLADGMIWNRTLSDAEVQELYIISLRGYPGLLNRVNPQLYSFGSQGTIFTTSASDNLGVSDSVSRLAQSLRKPSDNLGVSDSVSRLAQSLRNPSDNLGVSDSTARLAQNLRNPSDNLGVSDSVSRLAQSLRNPSDNVGATDSALRLVQAFRALTDNLGLTDSVAFGQMAHVTSASDNTGIQDQVTVRLIPPRIPGGFADAGGGILPKKKPAARRRGAYEGPDGTPRFYRYEAEAELQFVAETQVRVRFPKEFSHEGSGQLVLAGESQASFYDHTAFVRAVDEAFLQHGFENLEFAEEEVRRENLFP